MADSTTHPAESDAGIGKWSSTRKLSRGALDCTLRIESVPLLVVELFSSIHASASAIVVTPGPHAGGATIVHT